MKSSVTIAVTDKLKTGPWVYWNNLDDNIRKASETGFDAIELFSTYKDASFSRQLDKALNKNHIALSAVGTGAGKVLLGLTLSDDDPAVRKKAMNFIKEIISFGANFGAPAIIGSMQGNVGNRDRSVVLSWLGRSLRELSDYSAQYSLPLFYEPLNRYETDIFNTLGGAVEFIRQNDLENLRILADLFHMNIEEESLSRSIYEYSGYIGHIHFADSNRRPVGLGHTDIKEAAQAIKNMAYDKYISAEAFPYPDSDQAALKTMAAFNYYFGKKEENTRIIRSIC